MISLDKIKKVHFIGIGGIGMSALARFMLHENKEVSGSDASESDLINDLKKEGVTTHIGHQSNHINKELDLVVYTIAVQHSNPELEKARD
ncbi:MAG: Mur ligase domain-containing protein, partial [Candidatus Paceibacterota bacterium]